jgi:putative membrane protein
MATPRNAKGYLGLVARGIAMGIADVIPGVSGGTIAFIMGIYAELLETISALKLDLLKIWRNDGIAAAWRAANLNFLLALLLGIGIAIVSLANLIAYLLEQHEQLLWAFFFGLVLASIFLVGRDVKRWSTSTIVAFVAGAAIAVGVISLPPMAAVDFPGFLFVAGMIAICAMILPGISGSFLLLILGAYHDVIAAVKSFDLRTIAIFGAGCITGILGFSRLLNWMYKRHTDLTISLLTGFMLGSLPKIWPWQAKVELLHTHSDGREDWLRANIWPSEVEGDPQVLGVVFCLTAGCGAILLLARLAKTKA